uniref:Tight junction-associated protein 1 n=1 Tax=Phallusia mammillata TaxID=59560 RepID=A0A6F9DU62_9ASCI|nr:tight junction-associated protein 1 [Phallusia mammillata]
MAYNTNSGGKVYRPYRKASEYLTTQQKPTAPIAGPKSDLEKENEALRQKVLHLTRNLDHAEAEYSQSREYLESQLDVANDKLQRVSTQYKTLQSSYVTLQSTNRELENKVSKINRLENERGSMVQEINDLTRKITDARNSLLKSQEENERLRKDCNLAVQLLKCNQSAYASQRPEQIPMELQDRVSDYQVKLQDYNEYINPYADSDSDNEDRTRAPKPPLKETPNSISTDMLAKVLQKPENVHMNLEPADFIQDPQLTSTYKARYTEKKLIKPDYGNHQQESIKLSNSSSASHTGTSSPWEQSSGSGKLSSPWEQTQETSSESSPWERRTVPTGSQYADDNDDDEAPAGAYGVYAVGPKRRIPKKAPELKHKLNLNLPREPVLPPSHSVPSSPEELDFRKPTLPDAYIASTFLAKAADVVASSLPSSKSSSLKSSPYKVRGKVSASQAETSSLLTGDNSDDEDDRDLSVSQTPSPKKEYGFNEQHQPEGLGLLDRDEDIMDDLHDKEITLEWDPTDVYEEEELPAQLKNEEIKTGPDTDVMTTPAQKNLLLSYNEVEIKKEPEGMNLEDLLNMNVETATDTMANVNLTPSQAPDSGHLLSEIAHGNPSFESFLLTTPPPPQEFASTEKQPQPTEDAIYTQVDINATVNSTEQDDNVVCTNEANFSVQANDVIEVVDLDLTESQLDTRRRNSFEQAREYGNVMD